MDVADADMDVAAILVCPDCVRTIDDRGVEKPVPVIVTVTILEL